MSCRACQIESFDALGGKIFAFRLSRLADKFMKPRSHLLPPSGCLDMTPRLPLLSDCKTIVFASFASQRVAKMWTRVVVLTNLFLQPAMCRCDNIYTTHCAFPRSTTDSVALFLTFEARLERANVNSDLLCFILCRNHFYCSVLTHSR